MTNAITMPNAATATETPMSPHSAACDSSCTGTGSTPPPANTGSSQRAIADSPAIHGRATPTRPPKTDSTARMDSGRVMVHGDSFTGPPWP